VIWKGIPGCGTVMEDQQSKVSGTTRPSFTSFWKSSKEKLVGERRMFPAQQVSRCPSKTEAMEDEEELAAATAMTGSDGDDDEASSDPTSTGKLKLLFFFSFFFFFFVPFEITSFFY
jgi:hypothetical protein